ncbi:Hypothetical cytosolic protein [Lacticaseibacillus paracasei]|nr:Hypothetical cytosolic protein [Lacticaseibacillus paracasei]
MDELEALLAA